MSDTMESTGRTVDEAIREALLRMGLRREEVDVTVIQEARAGILGVGRRQAVVKVERKADRRRGARGPRGGRDEQGAPRSEAGSRTGERLDDGRDRRGGSRRGDRRRQDASGGVRDERERERDRDRGRDRGRRRDEAPAGAAPRAQDADKREATARVAQRRPDEGRPDATEHGDEDSKNRRRRRPRRRRKPGAEFEGPGAEKVGDGRLFGSDEAETPAVAPAVAAEPPAVAAVAPASEAPAEDPLAFLMGTEVEPEVVPAPDRIGTPAAAEPAEPAAPVRHVPRAATELVAGVVAVNRTRPYQAEDAVAAVPFLQRVATDLMVKSGFTCRVQVQEGEYHQVKMVVDDRSAGVLIGRYGNTVDAVEYLVEKVASNAAGDRVRMNLDINNYRLRREDNLVQRVRNAAAEARNTGRPVPLEPAGGRERRIAHLQIEELEDLTTYTETGPDGKFVVICRPDQVPEAYRQRAAAGDEEPVDVEQSGD
ncbi:MAG TPA: Jag N-terminal domain-containing protein [Candidatus Krumholzibacteria bacterium]|nr:Jag N-terminal domain-containing protein [Candidatus Krumholzibacteria bacterium]HPD73016.1 Jag N-terminal domain-containing protein [Candidatus Krumholzibacteria bacterium]HRY41815.1 Jag N-terminal domain-containing protein [Candidatus Krumholzibacteria bacterium]